MKSTQRSLTTSTTTMHWLKKTVAFHYTAYRHIHVNVLIHVILRSSHAPHCLYVANGILSNPAKNERRWRPKATIVLRVQQFCRRRIGGDFCTELFLALQLRRTNPTIDHASFENWLFKDSNEALLARRTIYAQLSDSLLYVQEWRQLVSGAFRHAGKVLFASKEFTTWNLNRGYSLLLIMINSNK